MVQVQMSLYLGLDCGGTKSRAMVVDSTGEVLFDKRSGPANLATTPWPLIEQHLSECLRGAPQVDAVCGCFAGLLTDSDALQASDLLRTLTKCDRVGAFPDYFAAWEIAKEQGELLVIAGTGVLICSEEYGKVVRSGGGGILLGDHGSTASIGRNALYRLVVSAPSSAEGGAFVRAVTDVFGSTDRNKVLSSLYSSESPALLLSSLAKTVGEDADGGKEYAVQAVDECLTRLATDIRLHIAAYLSKAESGSIVLAGGLWKLSPYFLKRFHNLLSLEKWSLKLVSQSPVHGACRLAMKIK